MPYGPSARAAKRVHPGRVGGRAGEQRGHRPRQAVRGDHPRRGGRGTPGTAGPGRGDREHGGRGHQHRLEAAGRGGQQGEREPPGPAPGRRAHRPRQPGVAEQQRPLAEQQPLGEVGVPRVQHRRGEARHEAAAGHERGRPGRGEHEDPQQDRLLHQIGGQHPRRGRQQQVARHRPGEPARGPGERRVRHDHHVVPECEPGPQRGPERRHAQHEPGERGRQGARRGAPPLPARRAGGAHVTCRVPGRAAAPACARR